jgi:hypothetical protein
MKPSLSFREIREPSLLRSMKQQVRWTLRILATGRRTSLLHRSTRRGRLGEGSL